MDALAVWCRRWLGAPPTAQLFEAGYLSTVTGLRLAGWIARLGGATYTRSLLTPAEWVAMQIRYMAPKRPTVSHVTAKLPFGEIQMYGDQKRFPAHPLNKQ